MPGKSGLEAAATVSRKHPELRILIFTMHGGKTLHSAAREAGAHGVVQKSFASRDLVRAIEALITGGSFFPKDSPVSSGPSLRSGFGLLFCAAALGNRLKRRPCGTHVAKARPSVPDVAKRTHVSVKVDPTISGHIPHFVR